MPTIRQQIIELLQAREYTALEISQILSIREREVYDHLQHIERSLARQGEKLALTPYACLHCGYIFADRSRWNRPGRCPHCKGGHIRMAGYRIVSE
jgi:transcriptional regulator